MPSITFTINIDFSLWWVVAYAFCGIAAMTIAIIKECGGRRKPRLGQVVKLFPMWVFAWPVLSIILIKDAHDSKKAREHWALERAYDKSMGWD